MTQVLLCEGVMLSAPTARVKRMAALPLQRIRITLSRGTSRAERAAVPPALKSRGNAGAPGAWSARAYTPEPDLSVPLRLTALPAPAIRTSGEGRGETWGARWVWGGEGGGGEGPGG